ncbi:MAG TPA: ANTAR domain-containing protein [Mycobacterium sp.]|uniref:ANTAR domain-containing protein n=1 Tax=Mycobacterium sp. TaxID=1785 RepID=UPI002C9D7B1C|nr:ANTAR domain-containing protein [Mycobacterium sp.]HME74276.1 ANTAR domain-containing protein [Mycobacterium sp.]
MIGALTPSSGASSAGTRVLDRAEGILVGLRRCRTESAFDEIVAASQQHVVPALRVARALVELAEGPEPSDPDAAAVARERWGDLLAPP